MRLLKAKAYISSMRNVITYLNETVSGRKRMRVCESRCPYEFPTYIESHKHVDKVDRDVVTIVRHCLDCKSSHRSAEAPPSYTTSKIRHIHFIQNNGCTGTHAEALYFRKESSSGSVDDARCE